MHKSVLAWVGATFTQASVAGKSILEVGSYDVNGSVRPLLLAHGPLSYLGVDAATGPGVDRVVAAEDLDATFGGDAFDVVVSTEMLEHAANWQDCLWNMTAVLKPGGLLILTTRSPGFPYHPFPDDHWRFTVPFMRRVLIAAGLVSIEVQPDPDPKSPGVLVTACKPDPWTPDRDGLMGLAAEPVAR